MGELEALVISAGGDDAAASRTNLTQIQLLFVALATAPLLSFESQYNFVQALTFQGKKVHPILF